MAMLNNQMATITQKYSGRCLLQFGVVNGHDIALVRILINWA
jgi:hypothetical protein